MNCRAAGSGHLRPGNAEHARRAPTGACCVLVGVRLWRSAGRAEPHVAGQTVSFLLFEEGKNISLASAGLVDRFL